VVSLSSGSQKSVKYCLDAPDIPDGAKRKQITVKKEPTGE
jgi:hypothetical protein